MDRNVRILYLGNDLAKRSKYHSAYATLKNNLIKQGYQVRSASSKKQQSLRLIDMVFSVIMYGRKTNFVLIDTFSTTAFYFAFITSQLCRLLHLKYIPILHGGDLPKRLKKSPFLCKLIFKHAHKNVSPSNYLKTEFESHFYKVVLIPNTINTSEYVFKERKQIKPKLLYVRAFATIYNPILAINLLKELVAVYPHAELCMVGPDRDGTLKKVVDKIKEFGLVQKVKVTGVLPKEEWHKLSADYDVFINTTNIDNTPVSLIESMALGLPIVSTNVGGIPYLVENNKEAILVEPNNIKAMVKGVIDLLENSEKTNSFSINGRNKAETMDWQVVKNQWERILT